MTSTWPFRPGKLTDILSPEELRLFLRSGADVGSTLSLIEKTGEDSYASIDLGKASRDGRIDPFCTFFRQGKTGGKPAFEGADEACAECEGRFARRLLSPASAPLALTESGVARVRCHMGLSDCIAPVKVGDRVLAGLIGGRRLEDEDDRLRIRKSAGKLGKLTRAELESAGTSSRIVIQPADEKARERLIQEIAAIPLLSREFESGLMELARALGRLASRQFDGLRWTLEDPVLDRLSALDADLPRNFADLRRVTQSMLARLRTDLGFEFLAFFALNPRDVVAGGARAGLIAESGLEANTAKRLLELDGGRIPPRGDGVGADVLRGLQIVPSAASVLCATPDAPGGLKDRLLRCIFFCALESETGWPSALVFGPALSGVSPEESDYRFLVRVARAVSQRYYLRALEVERRWMEDRVEREESGRKHADEIRRGVEEKLRAVDLAQREAARTRSFSHFDLRKLVESGVGSVAARAKGRGVEIDARSLPDRLMIDGERHRLAAAFQQMLVRAVERTRAEAADQKPAPVRVFLRRVKDEAVLGVEAIGESFDAAERRQLFTRDPEREPARGPRPGLPERDASGSRGAGEPPVPLAPAPVAPVPAGPDAAVTESAASEAAPALAHEVPAGSGEGTELPSGEARTGSGEGDLRPSSPSPEIPAPAGVLEEARGGRRGGRYPDTFRDLLATVRRHRGRFRVDGERLRRFADEPSKWLGKTTYVIHLPIDDGPGPRGDSPQALASRGDGSRAPRGRGEPRGARPDDGRETQVPPAVQAVPMASAVTMEPTVPEVLAVPLAEGSSPPPLEGTPAPSPGEA